MAFKFLSIENRENRKVRRLAKKQLKISEKIKKLSKKASNWIGRKGHLLDTLMDSIGDEARRELGAIINEQIGFFEYSLKIEDKDLLLGKSLKHILALEITREKGLVSLEEEAYSELQKRVGAIEADRQHIIENEKLLDGFKEEYARSLDEERETESEESMEDKFLSEEHLLVGVISGLIENLREQDNLLREIKEGSLEKLKKLFDEEKEKYAVLLNYKKVEDRIINSIDEEELAKKTGIRYKKSFWHRVGDMRKRGVVVATILFIFWIKAQGTVNEIYSKVYGNVVPQRVVQTVVVKDKTYWKNRRQELIRQYGLVKGSWYWNKEFMMAGYKYDTAKKLDQEISKIVFKESANVVRSAADYIEQADKEGRFWFVVHVLKAIAFLFDQYVITVSAIVYIAIRGIPILGFGLRWFERDLIKGLMLLGKDGFNLGAFLLERLRSRDIKQEDLKRLNRKKDGYWKKTIAKNIKSVTKAADEYYQRFWKS